MAVDATTMQQEYDAYVRDLPKRRREGVRKAALMLDEEVPGWENRIDPETLDMGDCHNCALGQIFGPRVEGKLWQILGPEIRVWRRNKGRSGYAKGLDKLTITQCQYATGAFSSHPELRCMWIEEAMNRKHPEKNDA